MAISDIVSRRLEILIERILGGTQIDVKKNPALGKPPIGLDTAFLRGEFLLRLNSPEQGFDDLLAKPVVASEVKEATKFNELVDAITKKNRIKTDDEYKSKMDERVRIGLRSTVAQMAGIDVNTVLQTDNVDKFLSPNPLTTARLQSRLTLVFEKYLFSPIARGDLKGTLATIKSNLVDRMVL
jgi:hypothetical protein